MHRLIQVVVQETDFILPFLDAFQWKATCGCDRRRRRLASTYFFWGDFLEFFFWYLHWCVTFYLLFFGGVQNGIVVGLAFHMRSRYTCALHGVGLFFFFFCITLWYPEYCFFSFLVWVFCFYSSAMNWIRVWLQLHAPLLREGSYSSPQSLESSDTIVDLYFFCLLYLSIVMSLWTLLLQSRHFANQSGLYGHRTKIHVKLILSRTRYSRSEIMQGRCCRVLWPCKQLSNAMCMSRIWLGLEGLEGHATVSRYEKSLQDHLGYKL